MAELDLSQKLKDALDECERLRVENAHLKSLLNNSIGLDPSGKLLPPPILNSINLSANEKIVLFRSLFNGREDVYAIRWESTAGKTGYSPALKSSYNKCHCKKPKLRCAICNQDKLLPLTDQVVYEHLSGKNMIGIYPLLVGDMCWFLAIDFDKSEWKEDVSAFQRVARKFSVPTSLELSQSGNGAHIWIFFNHAIPARLARQLGCALLTQTMRERHQLSLNSYDRLFPNQDVMPKGGFGNLIALPLQGVKRKNGVNIFLDKTMQPYSDQWVYLGTINKMLPQEVIQLVKYFSEKDEIIDIRKSQTDEKREGDGWQIDISNTLNKSLISESLPLLININISNHIYIETQLLSSSFINYIKKLAAFQNPEFYKAQTMRLPTYNKPRVISCAEDLHDHIALPRGCISEIHSVCKKHGIKTNINDTTYAGQPINVNFHGKLHAHQKKAADELIMHTNGVLAATTAFGKTIVAIWMIAQRRTNTLILVHRQQLMDQWRERLSSFLNIPTKEIGTIGCGKQNLLGKIDIAMLQSIFREKKVSSLVFNYGHVIVDECHHISAFSFEKVMKAVKARYILGLTATPIRKDGHHPIVMMQCGPIRYRANDKSMIEKNNLKYIVKKRYTSFCYSSLDRSSTIQDIYKLISTNEERNDFIFNDILQNLEEKRSPLLLTERIQHLEWFVDRLRNFAKNIIVLKGGMNKNQQQLTIEKLRSIPDTEERIILATGRYIGEGFDDARLDTLFLAMPISWQGTLQQYVGRLHRSHPAKQEVRVYDYIDNNVAVLARMYEKRLKKYRAIGYIEE